MSQTTKPQHEVPLSDLMLAMDIADTLRHRESIVEHELNEEEREKALYEKVKATYASQGIQVSDSTIRQAVKAIDEDRFAYKPRKKTAFDRWANIYINRGKWAKGMAGLAAIAALAWTVNWALVTLPQQAKVKKQALALNQTIESANTSEQSLQLKLDSLVNEINLAKAPADTELKTLFQRQHKKALLQLKTAATHIDNSRPLQQQSIFDKNNYQELGATGLAKVGQQQEQLNKASQLLNQAETSIKHLHQIKLLPDEMKNLRDEALGLARTSKASSLAQRYYEVGLASMRGLDFAAAQNTSSDLKDLIDKLQQSYQLKIVSRNNERTGLWRVPDVNSNARNYYIVVEAINNKGQALTLPITNEEDGSIYRVNKWALRVNKTTFDRIARDKQDDGIVQDNVFGQKLNGYLSPEYRFSTTGQAITSW